MLVTRLLALAAGLAPTVTAQNPSADIALILERRRVDMAAFTTPAVMANVSQWLSTQSEEGTWADVDYRLGCDARESRAELIVYPLSDLRPPSSSFLPLFHDKSPWQLLVALTDGRTRQLACPTALDPRHRFRLRLVRTQPRRACRVQRRQRAPERRAQGHGLVVLEGLHKSRLYEPGWQAVCIQLPMLCAQLTTAPVRVALPGPGIPTGSAR